MTRDKYWTDGDDDKPWYYECNDAKKPLAAPAIEPIPWSVDCDQCQKALDKYWMKKEELDEDDGDGYNWDNDTLWLYEDYECKDCEKAKWAAVAEEMTRKSFLKEVDDLCSLFEKLRVT